MNDRQQHLIILYDSDGFRDYREGRCKTIATYLRITSDPTMRINGAKTYAKSMKRTFELARVVKCVGDQKPIEKYIKERFARQRVISRGKLGTENPTNIYNLNKDDLLFLMNLSDGFDVGRVTL